MKRIFVVSEDFGDGTFGRYVVINPKIISHSEELIYVGEANLEEAGEIFGSFQEMISTSKKASSEDINYVLNKISELLISSLDESKLSKEEASIIVNKETIKVVNNKYNLNRLEVINLWKN